MDMNTAKTLTMFVSETIAHNITLARHFQLISMNTTDFPPDTPTKVMETKCLAEMNEAGL
jgi:hypothetical protein